MKIRTRFAPSPTGYMHIGNLRTALYNYLMTKHEQGDFILRIEDTDQQREIKDATDMIYEVLNETHLNWDEGPTNGGAYGPYIQSQRLDIYHQYAHKLVELNGAHYCFCQKEDEHENDPCIHLTQEEIEKKLLNKEPYVIRQTIPRNQQISFDDEVYGHIEVDTNTLNEGILIKSDGYPTYNFANVIDDHLMNITHVIRGNEYLSSTPKYNLIYNAFQWNIPIYIHLPPVMKDETHKLSKRNGDASYQDLIKQGFLKEAIINYIALLGCYFGDNEILSLDELINKFDVKHINKSSAIFDINKLKWMNGMYIRNMSLDDFHKIILPYYSVINKNIDFLELSKVLQPRLETLNDIDQFIDFINKPLPFDATIYKHKKMKTTIEGSLEVLKLILPRLEEYNEYDNDDKFVQLFVEFAKEHQLKNGQVMWPVRVALTNKISSPGGAIEIAHILGKKESLIRIKEAIQQFNNYLGI